MAYTPATKFPASQNYAQWGRPDHPNPRLTRPLKIGETTIYWSYPLKDHADAIITGDYWMSVTNDDGYTENIYIPAGAVAVNGLSATGIIRGAYLEGLDYTTGSTALQADHPANSPVRCNISPVNFTMMRAAMNGTIASGGNSWRVGDLTDSNITVYAQNADSNKPFFQYNAAANKWVFSNDGVSSTDFGTGAGVTGGDGISVTAGDIDIDLTDTIIFKQTSAGAGDAGKVPRFNASGLINQSVVEILKDVTSDASELNKLDGASANVTATNLNTLTAGSSSNASSLHTHNFNKKLQINTTDVTVGNTTTETDLFSVTVTGGTLSTNNGIKFKIILNPLVSSGGHTLDIRLKYGASTVANITRIPNAANTQGYIEGVLLADGDAASQKGYLELRTHIDQAPSGSTVTLVDAFDDGTGGANSASNQTLRVTAQWGTAASGSTLTATMSFIEIITV